MPIRRCVGCGREREKAELIRLVCYDSRVVVDYHHRLPGRGAYVCPERSCIERAMKKRRLERAFKFESETEQGGQMDYADLPAQIERAIKRQILGLLGLAARAGKVISGWNNVKGNLRRLKLILIAEDAAPSTLRRFAHLEGAHVAMGKEELGRALGKPPRSVIGVLDERWAGELARHLERYHEVRGRERDRGRRE